MRPYGKAADTPHPFTTDINRFVRTLPAGGEYPTPPSLTPNPVDVVTSRGTTVPSPPHGKDPNDVHYVVTKKLRKEQTEPNGAVQLPRCLARWSARRKDSRLLPWTLRRKMRPTTTIQLKSRAKKRCTMKATSGRHIPNWPLRNTVPSRLTPISSRLGPFAIWKHPLKLMRKRTHGRKLREMALIIRPFRAIIS